MLWKHHDEVHGPLMLQVDKVVDLVYTKYLKALVSYDGLQRIETFMTPKETFREVVLNAVNHKVYESGNPIQISVYEDKIIVFNQGCWPDDIDLDELYVRKHSSYPHNPSLSTTFFNAGDIEAYGEQSELLGSNRNFWGAIRTFGEQSELLGSNDGA